MNSCLVGPSLEHGAKSAMPPFRIVQWQARCQNMVRECTCNTATCYCRQTHVVQPCVASNAGHWQEAGEFASCAATPTKGI